MGVEAGFPESTQDHVKSGQDQGHEESIKFGAVNGLAKAEAVTSKDANIQQDAAVEWPEPKQIYSFYFVKFRPYDDPKLKVKIDQADRDIQKKNQARLQITEALRAKRSERANIISQLKPLTSEDKQYRAIIDGKRKEMEPFQAALGKLRTADIAAKNEGLCSSEQELNERICSLQFRIQHESNTLSEEKQLLKDIKFLEGTRERVIANASMKAQLGDSFGQKDEMVGYVKLIGNDLDGVRKEQQVVRAKIKKLEDELKAVATEIERLQDELAAVTQTKDKAHDSIRELLKSRDETNSCFSQNRVLLNNVRELAAKKDVAALEDLYSVEVEKFMSQWSSSKAFRDDYQRRILSSLDNRQLTRDGRMRNPGEKPIVLPETTTELETVSTKPNAKQVKDETIPPAKHKEDPVIKAPKEEGSKAPEGKKEKNSVDDQNGSSDDYVKSTKAPVVEKIDPAQLKAQKIAEEKAKALQAQERKKKQAEKAAAKAAAKVQKEEEKKQKEKEKKARKKTVTSATTATVEDTEADAEVDNPEEPETVDEAPAQVINANITQRTRSMHKANKIIPDRPRKVILKRKKSNAYWVWAIPGAIAAVVFAFLAYYYTAGKTSASQSS